MERQSKTDRVIEAMRTTDTITICAIREATNLPAHEIGGILASLERQERVGRADKEDGRNHWRLLRAEKRPRSHGGSHQAINRPRQKVEDQQRQEAANQSAVMLQNIVLRMACRAARRNASYA